MIRMVHSGWAARLAMAAVLVAVLVQSAIGLPLSLRMAEAGTTICHVSQGHGGSESPGLPVHDHEHCLLCQASAAPPMSATAPVLPPPQATGIAAVEPLRPAAILIRVALGFSSRAPPLLQA